MCTCAVKTKSLYFSLRKCSCACDDIASKKYKDLNYIMEEVIQVFPSCILKEIFFPCEADVATFLLGHLDSLLLNLLLRLQNLKEQSLLYKETAFWRSLSFCQILLELDSKNTLRNHIYTHKKKVI